MVGRGKKGGVLEKQKGISKEVVDYINRLPLGQQLYFTTLYRQFNRRGKILKIGKNFIPAAFLKNHQRKKELGIVDYSLIKKDPTLEKFAAQTKLICNPMDGGTGSSLNRADYLRRIWQNRGRGGKPRLGAKGVDLFFDLKVFGHDASKKRVKINEKVSITELKYLQATRESSFYNKIIIEELVNKESRASLRHFLDKTINFWDRINREPQKEKLSYRQLIAKEKKICLADRMIIQLPLPGIDKKKNCLTLEHTAPGGHGQLGYLVLEKAARRKKPLRQNLVRAIYNGDGVNNFPNRFIVGFMVKNRIPLAMLVLPKTVLDRKGGLIGLESDKLAKRVQIFELAQAKKAGQQDLFKKIGLAGFKESVYGQAGKQYFNTNVALINYRVLLPFLKDLSNLLGEEKFSEIISPDLIKNEKKQKEKTYIQLEGALASVFFNLAGFIKESRNKKIKDLIKKHKIKNFLTLININQKERTQFFTPVKFAWDFWLYAYSDCFKINRQNFKLENLKPGNLPSFNLDFFYHNLENCIQALGRASVINLKSLTIKGKVFLKNAELAGRIIIENQSPDIVDLNAENFRKQLKIRKKRLFIKNTKIKIGAGKKIKKEPF